MRLFISFISLALLATSLLGSISEPQSASFHGRVDWVKGKEWLSWSPTLSTADGVELFRLELRPLLAVEGGVVEIELVVTSHQAPETNILGKRVEGEAQAFEITVEDLKRGIKKSKYGSVRVFDVGGIHLQVRILKSRLGRGLSDCPKCRNIQVLSTDVTFSSK